MSIAFKIKDYYKLRNNMIARTKLLTFAISFLLLFSALVTLFSPSGYLVNRNLREYEENISLEIERKKAEIRMLRSAERDDAPSPLLAKGSYEIVDVGTYEGISAEENASSVQKEGFEGIGVPILLLISILLSFTVTAVTDVLRRIPGGKHGDRKKQ